MGRGGSEALISRHRRMISMFRNVSNISEGASLMELDGVFRERQPAESLLVSNLSFRQKHCKAPQAREETRLCNIGEKK